MRKTVMSLAVCTALLQPLPATETGDIGAIEKQLIQTEIELLDAELQKDRGLQQNWKFRGILGWLRGWFHRSEKKAVEALLEESDGQIRRFNAEVRATEGKLQQEVFNVGQMHESQGDFETAIQYYLKVAKKTDRVCERLAWCYRQLQKFSDAVSWYLKMRPTDSNFLKVAHTYWEATEGREAITWMFRILEPFAGNDAELSALETIEAWTYSGRELDFPGFSRRLSRVWVAKALQGFEDDFHQSLADYQTAVELRAEGREPRLESQDILAYYRDASKQSQETLEEKREEAYERYEYMLQEAERKVLNARERLSEAERQAYRDYEYALQRTRRSLSEARIRLNDLKASSESTEQQLKHAKRRLRDLEYRLQDLMNHQRRFIENELEPYRRRLERAQRAHTHLIQSRQQIIKDFVQPYQRKLKQARENERRIHRLHSESYQ